MFKGIALALAASSLLCANPIAGLTNTGFGLSGGSSDPNWEILIPSQQGVVVAGTLPSTWIPDSAGSQWIWETASGQPINLTLTFRAVFDIPVGFDPKTASIQGRWASDNTGLDILLNGVSTGQTSSGYTSWTPFGLSNGFVSGQNTLDFVVHDYGVISGFRAEFTGSSMEAVEANPLGAVPEPAALILVAGGLLGLGSVRLFRKALHR